MATGDQLRQLDLRFEAWTSRVIGERRGLVMRQTIGVLCLLAAFLDVALALARLAPPAIVAPAGLLVPLGVRFLRPSGSGAATARDASHQQSNAAHDGRQQR